jgi:hypothetical protein
LSEVAKNGIKKAMDIQGIIIGGLLVVSGVAGLIYVRSPKNLVKSWMNRRLYFWLCLISITCGLMVVILSAIPERHVH